MATGVDYGIPAGLANAIDSGQLSQTAIDHLSAIFGLDSGEGGGFGGGQDGGSTGGGVVIVGSPPLADPSMP